MPSIPSIGGSEGVEISQAYLNDNLDSGNFSNKAFFDFKSVQTYRMARTL